MKIKSFTPLIAVFGTSFLITISLLKSFQIFMGISICLLAMLKLMDINAFGTSYNLNSIPDEAKLQSDLKKITEHYLLLTHRGGLDSNLAGSDFEPENLKDQDLEERKKLGIPENLIRCSVGIEHINDIKNDFDQALIN